MQVDLTRATADQLHEYWSGAEAARTGKDARAQPGGTGEFWVAGWLSIGGNHGRR